MWNKTNTIGEDEKFVRMLLLDLFGVKHLRESSLKTLSTEKIRFVQGTFVEAELSFEI